MNDETRGGYSYVVTDEQILEWMDVPVEDKLQWVEDMCELAHELRTEETREIADLFRRGLI